MAGRIVMRTGEALVEGGKDYLCAEPEVVIGELDGPVGQVDRAALFRVNREATAKVIRKAMRNEPTIDWLLENQDAVAHYFHQLGLDGKL